MRCIISGDREQKSGKNQHSYVTGAAIPLSPNLGTEPALSFPLIKEDRDSERLSLEYRSCPSLVSIIGHYKITFFSFCVITQSS